MRLRITHRTDFAYDRPLGYALSRLLLHPRSGPLQEVLDWSVTVENGSTATSYTDHFGNIVHLAEVSRAASSLHVTASGEVETIDRAGVLGPHVGHAPLWLFQQATELTAPGEGVAALAAARTEGDALSALHALSADVARAVVWREGSSDVRTTAEGALAAGQGVCQDQAQVFIAAARALGYPARYVSGYFAMEREDQAASHAWAEAHVEGLGWVGFDVANAISPDARHVRVAVGRDYADCAPISGLRYGRAAEDMRVSVTVERQQ